MTGKNLSLSTKVASLAVLFSITCHGLFAKSIDGQGEARIYTNDGLATVVFHGQSGGTITTYLPLNINQNDTQIGGTVERLLPAPGPKTTPKMVEEQTAEIAGVVTIEANSKTPNSPPAATCPPENPNFTLAVPPGGTFLVTYKPLKGAPLTATVECPIQPPPAPSTTCDIPKLTSCAGNIHISMQCTSGEAKSNTCEMNGIAAPCRAWSSEGCIFEVPPAAQLPPGPCAVHVTRGNHFATGETHVAQVKVTCSPNQVRQGQQCKIITSIVCPGLKNVNSPMLSIKNHNPNVLKFDEKQVAITDAQFTDETAATGGETGRYGVYASVHSAAQPVPVLTTAAGNAVPQ